MTAMNLLNDRGVYPFDIYAGWIRDGSEEEDVTELAVELMAERADLAADLLFPLIDGADLTRKTLIAEILVNAPKDERTYKLLTELFLNGGNVPLYAGISANTATSGPRRCCTERSTTATISNIWKSRTPSSVWAASWTTTGIFPTTSIIRPSNT